MSGAYGLLADESVLRILHVAAMRRWGGITTLVRDLATHQRHVQGLDVAVLCSLKGSDEHAQPLRDANVPVLHAGLSGGYDLRADRYYRVLRTMRQYDVVHLHEFHPLVAATAAASRRLIVHTEHGTFQRLHQRSLKAFIKKRVLGTSFLKHGTDVVVFISRWLRQDIDLSKAETMVIYNGTAAKLEPQTRRRDNQPFRVLTAGRFEPRKRIDRLITAFGRAYDGHSILDIVGDGTLAASLQQLSSERLPSGSCRFHGYQARVDAYYGGTDLFVLPAEREPFGLVVVEAMCRGIPAICFRDGGGAVEIVEGVHDRLVVSNEMELANAIRFWRDHPDERVTVGRVLAERAEREFSTRRMADDYLALYRRLVASRAASATIAAPATT